MSESLPFDRRHFLKRTAASAGAMGATAAWKASRGEAAEPQDQSALASTAELASSLLPLGSIGKAKISRMLLGGNLIAGYMHARDLKYVGPLFRAYCTEEKILETLKLAEQCGINTVFETGASFIQRYNREFGGHMQFIPHIEVERGQSEASLKEHIQKQVDSGAVALYVWGAAADRLVQAGAVDDIARAVELAKRHDLPVGVGGHSLLVPMECEKHQVPCDFYVKTLHSDAYPSATPKELRKEFAWFNSEPGWYDNMWCINPEETIEFMKTVTKPWIAFKVLAAGAFIPQQGFNYAFHNGADFIAVGMFDFQVRANCELLRQVVRSTRNRPRPWRA